MPSGRLVFAPDALDFVGESRRRIEAWFSGASKRLSQSLFDLL